MSVLIKKPLKFYYKLEERGEKEKRNQMFKQKGR
jgi:hypothetical protein